jgi:hypothetical protein
LRLSIAVSIIVGHRIHLVENPRIGANFPICRE